MQQGKVNGLHPRSSFTLGLEKLTGAITALNGGPLVQRDYELTTTGVTQYTTPSGNFYRFPPQPRRRNMANRPRFIHPRSVMVAYTGPGAAGSVLVHPAVTSALNTLMSQLRAEGERIDDESLRQADITSAFRPPTAREGRLYLQALQRTIRRNPRIFGSLTFPTSLESMAQSELGHTGSPRHRAFVRALAGQPGWLGLAQRLVNITRRYKAPRGGSTHHSGVVVDIDFPYATSTTRVQRHGVDRSRNGDALRAAAGVWLNTHSRSLGFDTYDTSAEIWHQEWRNWAGTAADPASSAAGGTAAAEVAAPEAAEAPPPEIEAAEAAPPPPTPTRTYTVASGDTLSEIAARFGTTVEAIMRANGLSDPDRIRAGQELTIPGGTAAAPAPETEAPEAAPPEAEPAEAPPPETEAAESTPPPPTPTRTYTVAPGDTLSEIAARFGTTVEAIMRANGLSDPDRISAGQELTIPGGRVATPAPGGGPTTIPVPPTPTPATPCALTRFTASNYVGEPVISDVEFVDELNRINDYAGNRNVQLYITDSFREAGRTVSGAIVTPARYSNHLAGHAIDMNARHGGRLYNSSALRRANLSHLPAEVQGFINDIRGDTGLRWGGDFSREDPVHIDDHLNANMAAWRARYQATQEARRSGCG
jgi:LysM repeat protein